MHNFADDYLVVSSCIIPCTGHMCNTADIKQELVERS